MKKKNLHAWITTGLFCSFLGCGALLSILLPKRSFSETENRYLAQKPAFTWESLKTGEFGKQYEDYLSDQFPFRDGWISLKTAAELAQGKREINGVWTGNDGWLMETWYRESFDHNLAEKNLEKLAQFASSQAELLGENRIRIMLVPSSPEILPQHLPDFASPFSQEIIPDTLKEKGLSSMLIPVGDALYKAAENAGPTADNLYYRTDHHWTSHGAFLAYQAWADSLGIKPYEKNDFTIETVTEQFSGTIQSKINLPVRPDQIDLYRPVQEPSWSVFYDGNPEPSLSLYSMEALHTRDKYRVFLDGNHGWTKIKNQESASNRRLLILKDSYAHTFAPFAALHFDETHMLDLRYFNGKVSQFCEKQQITDILVLYQIPVFLKDRNVSKLTW